MERGRWTACLLFALALGLVGSQILNRESSFRAVTGPAAPPVEGFLARHWSRPLAPQGDPPREFSAGEASLAPAACGRCHGAQFKDWRTSLHARAAGPGLLGQLVTMTPEEAESCLDCHGPLAEQKSAWRREAGYPAPSPPAFAPPDLHMHGLVCVGCHVRGHRRLGPPRRPGTSPPTKPVPHGGFTAEPAFEDAAFCRGCHQSPEGAPALNGKPLQNTYEEWRQSPYARRGVSCQSCHMPGRRHLWRGIHDPAMVRSGVQVAFDLVPRPGGGAVAFRFRLANTGVGHAYPTYVTPAVTVSVHLVDAAGRQIPGTRQSRVIGRQVSLDLSEEIADTRVLPGRAFRWDGRLAAAPTAVAAVAEVAVEPQAFYIRFYEARLPHAAAGEQTAALTEALERARAARYVLLTLRRELKPPGMKGG